MLTKILITVTIFLLFFLIIFRYIKSANCYKQSSLIPSLKRYPIIGNAHILLGKSNIEIIYKFLDIYDKYPSPFGFWFFNQIWISVYKPEHLKIVLTSPKTLAKSKEYKKSEPMFGNGLICAQVPIWRIHRKLIQPAFNAKVLRSFIEIFDKHSKKLVDKLAENANGEEVFLAPYLEPFALNVACESTMGLPKNGKVDEKYSHNIHRLFEIMAERMGSVWLYSDTTFKISQFGREFEKRRKYLHDASNYIVQEKKKNITSIESGETEANKGKIKPFIDLILELEEEDKFSDKDVIDECTVMIVAASDTVGKALQFMLLILASRPDIQDKILEELKGIFGDENPEKISFTSEHLQKMEYLERVIKESLRLFPAAPLIMRRVEEDLVCDNYTFPQGTEIVIPILFVHRDARYWPDPLKFDPDRFLPEEVAKRHPYSFIPFSAGPRNCVGQVYAIMEMKIFLSRVIFKLILKKENAKPMEDIKFKFNSLLTPSEPISIKIENRMSR